MVPWPEFHRTPLKEIAILRPAHRMVVLCFALAALAALADPIKVQTPRAEGIFGEGSNQFGQPDSRTGAMSWTLPIKLIAARGRPQPDLSLSYNSSSHDREAGYGWGLNLPVIELRPPPRKADVC
jgi:hypothetical protein